MWSCLFCIWVFPDSNLRLFVSRDGTTALSGIRLGNRWVNSNIHDQHFALPVSPLHLPSPNTHTHTQTRSVFVSAGCPQADMSLWWSRAIRQRPVGELALLVFPEASAGLKPRAENHVNLHFRWIFFLSARLRSLRPPWGLKPLAVKADVQFFGSCTTDVQKHAQVPSLTGSLYQHYCQQMKERNFSSYFSFLSGRAALSKCGFVK